MTEHILITGGAGFIGSHLAEGLLNRGAKVAIIDNLSTGRFENIEHLVGHPDFSYVIESIMDEQVMDGLVKECEVVIHLAAAVGVELIVKDPVQVIETNVLGTHSVLRLANRYHRKVLIASTSEIYGKSDHVPFSEEDDRLLGPTTKARWSYSTSKAVDEFLGLAYYRQTRLPVVIFRLFNTIGPRQSGQYGMVVPRFVRQALRGEPLTVYGDGQQRRCFCDVEDVVGAIIALVESPGAVGQVFNIGNTEEVTIQQLAERVWQLVGASDEGRLAKQNDKDPIVYIPYDRAYEPGFEDMRRRIPDIGKIKALTGWEPKIPLTRTLERIIDLIKMPG